MNEPTPKTRVKQQQNFANLSQAKRAEVARMGGLAAQRAGRSHKFTSEEARAASRKGHAARAAKKAATQGTQS